MTQKPSAKTSPEQTQNIFGMPLAIFGVPVDRDTIFKNAKGVYKEKIEKRQRKLIAKVSFIKFFLHHGECIRCVTTAYSPIGILEQVLTGPAFLFFKRALLVFTDKRVLHVPTRFSRSSHSSVSQIRYEDCAGIILKGRSLIVHYKNDLKETFPYLGRKEKKKIASLLKELTFTPKEVGRLQSRAYLCPSCTNILEDNTTVCPSCKLRFKSTLQAKIRSWLIPGGGYFYSRHTLAGIVAGTLECVLMGYLIYQWISYKQGLSISLGWPAICIVALLIEKSIVTFHALLLIKERMPEKKDYPQRKI